MSSDLKNRLYNYEVTPPVTAWENIAGALDESHLDNKFPSTLYNSTITAPATVWTAISESLDELQLGSKFPETLYNLSAPPPAQAWDKIQAALDSAATAPVIPARRKVIPFVRYAAAAAVLAIVAFGTVRILSSGNQQSADSGVKNTPASGIVTTVPPAGNDNTNNVATTPVINEPSAITNDEARNDAALEDSKQTYASLDRSDKQRMKKVSEEFFRAPADPIEVSANFNPVHTYEDLECTDVNTPVFASGSSSIDMAGRYAMLVTPDGHIIRISKKLGDLVCCVSGEEQDDECVDQLKKWRKKIANSPVAPSPGNFMDILDMLHTLKDSNL
jgi:negative regulator of sigma E activity